MKRVPAFRSSVYDFKVALSAGLSLALWLIPYAWVLAYPFQLFVTFIHEGLSRGARCIFTGTKEDYDVIGQGLEELGICTRRASARGALQIRSVEEIYFPDGTFNPPRSLDITVRVTTTRTGASMRLSSASASSITSTSTRPE